MSDKIRLVIDGTEVFAEPGTTILNAAAEAGIEIPNLCYLKELGPYGACGVCVVEVKGSPKLVRACSAKVAPDMEVSTGGERCLKARKLALELIMGDHDADCVAPCSLRCPAHTNCQKYIKQIAEGDDAAAVLTIKEKIPLPASVGRVCPHPCEKDCRRQNVEESISICALKAFAADSAEKETPVLPAKKPATGKKVAIVGGGPAGLTAAYFLALEGHSPVVFDMMPAMGGMLRYGIPEYRLPKAVLDREIAAIASLGVEMRNGVRMGADFTLDSLRSEYDAVLLANGAWKSSELRCPGTDAAGVFGGIDFLREVALGGKPDIGDRVAIVGGGNTAMDACRTAVRLGAKEVSVVYRRTRDEMPAEDIEIDEAIEEGVVFRFLTNPAEIRSENGRVTGAKLQVMELGEPDERGRRRPVPVEGKFIDLELDSVIIAVGQKNDPAGFEDVPVTDRGTIESDPNTFATSLEGVFAAGDNAGKGAEIAIEAIADAGRAAKFIDAYLNGIDFAPLLHDPVISKRKTGNVDFSQYDRKDRAVMPKRAAEERRSDFLPVDLGLSAETARAEAKRCLECGCHAYGECRLIKFADCVGADCAKYTGEFHRGFVENKVPSVERNQRKCLQCGLCVRICAEEVGEGILGLVGRGFDTVIRPEFATPEQLTKCASCSRCAEVCPTGALRIVIPE